MLFPKPSTVIALLVLLVFTLAILAGCDESTPTEPAGSGPVEDPGQALIAQLRPVNQSITTLLNDTRNRLNAAQGQLSPFSPGPDAASVLDNLVTLSDNKVWMSLLINTDGIIAQTHPTSLDSLAGRNWSDWSEIASPLAEGGLATGRIRHFNGKATMLYTRSINDDPAQVEGLVAAGVQSDQILLRAVDFAAYPDSAGYSVFVLDQDGTILRADDTQWVGMNLTDEAAFDTTHTNLAARMLDVENVDGSEAYDANGAPGGSGNKRLAWLQAPILDDHYWVLAITEPLEEE